MFFPSVVVVGPQSIFFTWIIKVHSASCTPLTPRQAHDKLATEQNVDWFRSILILVDGRFYLFGTILIVQPASIVYAKMD